MQGNFDPVIVALSALAAALAVYVALDLTGRVAAADGTSRWAWVLAGALSTGAGMWTMHFTGMLALSLPVGVSYTMRGIAAALAIAVAASTMALLVSASGPAISITVLAAGTLLGLGMGAMHVVAVGAMRMAAKPVMDTGMIALSIVVAIIAGIALISMSSRLRADES